MVGERGNQGEQGIQLSVLALSSRFDGPRPWSLNPRGDDAFSTRSVESF